MKIMLDTNIIISAALFPHILHSYMLEKMAKKYRKPFVLKNFRRSPLRFGRC